MEMEKPQTPPGVSDLDDIRAVWNGRIKSVSFGRGSNLSEVSLAEYAGALLLLTRNWQILLLSEILNDSVYPQRVIGMFLWKRQPDAFTFWSPSNSPVFDSAEDKNGTRNHDEIRFWSDYVSPSTAGYIVDDAGQRGGLRKNEFFVIAGDLNADPVDGDSTNEAINQYSNILFKIPNQQVREEPKQPKFKAT